MIWIIAIVILGVLIYFIFLKKQGNLDFWKLANEHRDEAYELFKNDDCWIIIEDNQQKPTGDVWDGPFMHKVPMLGNKMITVYGKSPDYLNSQNKFINNLH